jgi:hypothetical protein
MDCQDAVEFVKYYYDHTWNNLLWLLGIAFGLIGIVIPLVMQWIQSRNNQEQIKELNENYKILHDTKINDLKNIFNEKINELNINFEKNKGKFDIMEKDMFFIQGCMYITQGNILMKSEMGDTAATKILHSFLYAAFCFLTSEREENLKFVIKTLIDIMNSKDFPQLIPAKDYGIDAREIYDMTIYLLDKKNYNGKYTTIINLLKERIHFKD